VRSPFAKSTGGELVPFPTRPPAEVEDSDNLPAVIDAEVMPAAIPAPVATVEPIDLVVRRAADYRPVLPGWAKDVAELRRALRWLGRFAGHRAAFHGVRVPLYLGRTLAYAPRGALRLMVVLNRWAFDVEAAELRWAAVAAKDHKSYMNLSRQRNERVKRRLTVAMVVAVLALVVLAVASVVLSGALLVATLLSTVAGLGYAGRPRGRGFLSSAADRRGPVRLTQDIVLRAFAAAGLCKADDPIAFATPCHRDGDGWRVILDLPYGTPAKKAVLKRAEIASGLDVLAGQVFIAAESGATGSARRIELWVAEQDPTTVPAGPSPLLTASGVNFWQAWPFGVDERGREIKLCLLWLSMVVGGLPRMGKSFVARLAVLAAALDPDVRLLIFDLKGSPDWRPFRHVAHELHQGEDVDPDTGVDPVGRLLEVARELRAEVNRRNRVLRTLPASDVPEGKLTERLCRARHMGMPLVLLFLDEVHRAFTHREFGAELAEELSDLVRVGPSVGVMVISATQKPGSIGAGKVNDAWNTYRDNHSCRFGLRVGSYTVSEMILGQGAYGEGLDCSTLPEAAKGVGIVRGTGDVAVPAGTVRTYLVDGKGAEVICQRGRQLREQAGTLSGMAAGEQPAEVESGPRRSLLADLIEVIGADEQAHSDVLCSRLAESSPEVYGGWRPEQLAAALKPHSVATRQVWAKGTDGAPANRRGVARADLYAAGRPSGGADS